MEEEEYHFEDDEQEYQKFLAMVQLDPADLMDDTNDNEANKENDISGEPPRRGDPTQCIRCMVCVKALPTVTQGRSRLQSCVVQIVLSSLWDGFVRCVRCSQITKQWFG